MTLNGWRRLAVGGAWLCTLVGVATLSLLPETNPAVGCVPPEWADLAHVPAYALLTMLTILVAATRVRMSRGILVMILLLLSLFGGVIEILQTFTGRTASVLDVAWNSAGVALAAWSHRAWTTGRAADTEKPVAKSAPLPRLARVAARGRGECK